MASIPEQGLEEYYAKRERIREPTDSTAPTLLKVKCPVLAIKGEKDLQIAPKESLHAIKEALRTSALSRII